MKPQPEGILKDTVLDPDFLAFVFVIDKGQQQRTSSPEEASAYLRKFCSGDPESHRGASVRSLYRGLGEDAVLDEDRALAGEDSHDGVAPSVDKGSFKLNSRDSRRSSKEECMFSAMGGHDDRFCIGGSKELDGLPAFTEDDFGTFDAPAEKQGGAAGRCVERFFETVECFAGFHQFD